MFEKYKNIFYFALIVGLVYLGYLYYYGGTEQAGLTSVDAKDSENIELIARLRQVDGITIDEGLFTDPVFLSLTDSSKLLTPEPVGRDNPFLPIGAIAAPAPVPGAK